MRLRECWTAVLKLPRRMEVRGLALTFSLVVEFMILKVRPKLAGFKN